MQNEKSTYVKENDWCCLPHESAYVLLLNDLHVSHESVTKINISEISVPYMFSQGSSNLNLNLFLKYIINICV